MPEETLLLVFVFMSVALCSAGAMSLVMTRGVPERRRLQEIVRPTGTAAPTNVLIDRPYAAYEWAGRFRRRSPRTCAKLRARLIAAGHHPEAMCVLAAIELGAACLGGIIPLVLMGGQGMVLSLVGIACGLVLPAFVLGRKAARRRTELENGLPDALDLMVVALDAGCTVTQAIARATIELHVAHPALAQEFSAMQAEIHAGTPRTEALQRLAERTQVDGIRSLTILLAQSERCGTGIAATLRTHARASREKRRQRAEERANTAGIKLVFPLVLCIFPAFYVVTLGPVIIHVIRVFSESALARP